MTGAEFVNAYTEFGVTITVVASRDQILPHEDSDAAAVLEEYGSSAASNWSRTRVRIR